MEDFLARFAAPEASGFFDQPASTPTFPDPNNPFPDAINTPSISMDPSSSNGGLGNIPLISPTPTATTPRTPNASQDININNCSSNRITIIYCANRRFPLLILSRPPYASPCNRARPNLSLSAST